MAARVGCAHQNETSIGRETREAMAEPFRRAALEHLEVQAEARGWLQMVEEFCLSRQAPEGARLKLYSLMYFCDRIPLDAATYLVFTTAAGMAAKCGGHGWQEWPERPQVLAPILWEFAPEWADVIECEDFGAEAMRRFEAMMESGQMWAMPAAGWLN